MSSNVNWSNFLQFQSSWQGEYGPNAFLLVKLLLKVGNPIKKTKYGVLNSFAMNNFSFVD